MSEEEALAALKAHVYFTILDVIMDRARLLGFRFDYDRTQRRLHSVIDEIVVIPREVASLPDAKLAEWWEANIARPNPVQRKASPSRNPKR